MNALVDIFVSCGLSVGGELLVVVGTLGGTVVVVRFFVCSLNFNWDKLVDVTGGLDVDLILGFVVSIEFDLEDKNFLVVVALIIFFNGSFDFKSNEVLETCDVFNVDFVLDFVVSTIFVIGFEGETILFVVTLFKFFENSFVFNWDGLIVVLEELDVELGLVVSIEFDLENETFLALVTLVRFFWSSFDWNELVEACVVLNVDLVLSFVLVVVSLLRFLESSFDFSSNELVVVLGGFVVDFVLGFVVSITINLVVVTLIRLFEGSFDFNWNELVEACVGFNVDLVLCLNVSTVFEFGLGDEMWLNVVPLLSLPI